MYKTRIIYDDKIIAMLPNGVFPKKGDKLHIAVLDEKLSTYEAYEVLEYRYFILNGELEMVDIIVVKP